MDRLLQARHEHEQVGLQLLIISVTTPVEFHGQMTGCVTAAICHKDFSAVFCDIY